MNYIIDGSRQMWTTRRQQFPGNDLMPDDEGMSKHVNSREHFHHQLGATRHARQSLRPTVVLEEKIIRP